MSNINGKKKREKKLQIMTEEDVGRRKGILVSSHVQDKINRITENKYERDDQKERERENCCLKNHIFVAFFVEESRRLLLVTGDETFFDHLRSIRLLNCTGLFLLLLNFLQTETRKTDFYAKVPMFFPLTDRILLVPFRPTRK